MKETYPNRLPPLRQDRDSILIGTLKGEANPAEMTMVAEVNGQPVEGELVYLHLPREADDLVLARLPRAARERELADVRKKLLAIGGVNLGANLCSGVLCP